MCKQAQIQANTQQNKEVIFVQGSDWSTGVVGLIASRMKEQFGKPCIAIGFTGGDWVGSGRSVEGFNMIGSIQTMPQHFTKFGGHPMACGFTLKNKEAMSAFQTDLCAAYLVQTAGKEMVPTLAIDAQLTLGDISWELYEVLQKFEPFGKDNTAPTYAIQGAEVQEVKGVGKENKHINLFLRQHNKYKKTIGWNFCKQTEGKTNWCLALKKGDLVDVACTIGVNEWNGNKDLQLTIVDIKNHVT